MEVKTNQFTFSNQAKKLPETILIDEEFTYILGLWRADRCSTAKGIVGLRSKDNELIDKFKKFLEKLGLETKERIVRGYGVTKEVYSCSMPLRRIFENILKNRTEIFDKNLILSYFGDLIDGDGTIIKDKKQGIIRIFYEKKDTEEIEKDRELLKKIGVLSKVTSAKTRNLMILTIRKISTFSKLLLPFIMTNRKFRKLKFYAEA